MLTDQKITQSAAYTPAIVPASGMSLYLHVPFCQTKCGYCDFNTYQGIEHLMSPYRGALTTELGLWGQLLDHPAVNTVFFGGGTPSYLPEGDIGLILEAAGAAFAIESDAEITIEANPGDLTLDRCVSLRRQGVNRMSIGVQSLNNDLLALLGRRHDAAQAIEAFQTARRAGFDNVSLDLIYGLPHQSLADWQDTLQRLAAQEPNHISLYCLTVEEGTPLHVWVEQGKVPYPDVDLAADMYHHAEEVLADLGYEHYEISNWTRPGLASRHNLAYWQNDSYLGLGPGAHSSLDGYRFWEIDSPREYIERVRQWAETNPAALTSLSEEILENIGPVGGQEYIDPDLAASETMFLGLRLLGGLNLAEASARLGQDLQARYQSEIDDLIELNLLEWHGNLLRLTPPTYLVANQVFTRFLA